MIYYFNQFNVIITANLPINTLYILANHLWTLKIPLIVARTYGLDYIFVLVFFYHYF
jgi:hypothetical protein